MFHATWRDLTLAARDMAALLRQEPEEKGFSTILKILWKSRGILGEVQKKETES